VSAPGRFEALIPERAARRVVQGPPLQVPAERRFLQCRMPTDVAQEIAVAAAQLVVDEGAEYGAAKRKAARVLGRRGGGRPSDMPSNEVVEDEVRAHIAIFCADTQPGELFALRHLALSWMLRLEEFRPHLAGAVWRGTATRLSDVHIDLYCDDPKSTEIALINTGVHFDVSDAGRGSEPLDVLTVAAPCPDLGSRVLVHLTINDLDAQRGALKPDARGRSWRGGTEALRRLMTEPSA
jgi:hypothetical protein